MRFFLITLAFCVLAVAPAMAQGFVPNELLELAQNDGMTLSEAVESVRQRTDGRIVSAETETRNGNEVHHIKVLTKDGKVKTYTVQGRKSERG
ncbi:MAG: hypothetical protein O2907_06435 [Proteobacteria bacterium]|nr:hypothetical protein [Pseudomonadota bacterium]MDA1063951.1 hypothetical protein [Pseudomonadota bacterium]